MPHAVERYVRHFLASIRTALFGPQILAFVPAITLGGYWFGGEGVLLFMAIILPALLGLVGLFTPMHPRGRLNAHVDPITGLPMRAALISALDAAFCREAETGLRSAALVLEIDDFSQYRSAYGDTAADRILVQSAERIKDILRSGDIVTRPEGALFAIALAPVRRADLESLVQISTRLQSAMSEPMLFDGLRLFLTCSVGFCAARHAPEKNGLACLEAAETALADAQASGTAAIRAYSAQPRRKRVTRTGLVQEVALALDGGQITTWFQPQICTDTGIVSGMEALARWDHPDRGIILPGAFLPAISAAGMTDRLAEVVLFHALSAVQAWDKAAVSVPTVGVNFSGDDLSDPHLCDKIRWELDRFDLAPGRLTIEVLETVIAQSANDTITRNIMQLADFGCGIDLDDFGTGHASIANIRRFSIGRIKIDRSFITRIDSDRQQQQMLTAILEMADRLDVETLAEGVETSGEHVLLSQLGCRHVQGDCIARPLRFGETIAWLKDHRSNLAEQPQITRQTG